MKRRVALRPLRRLSRVGEPASGNANCRAHAPLANIRCEPALADRKRGESLAQIDPETRRQLDLFAEFKTHIDLLNAIRFQDPLARSNRWPSVLGSLSHTCDHCGNSF